MAMRIEDEQMRQLRIDVAKALGEGWTHNPNGETHWEGSQITRAADKATISLTNPGNQRGKVHISGWHKDFGDMYHSDREKTPMPDIYVSFDRGTDVIVREIQRRVLPGLDAAVAAALAAKSEKLAYGQRHKQTIDRLTAAFGKKFWRSSNQENVLKGEAPQVTLTAGAAMARPRVEVKVSGPTSIDFAIDCENVDTAVKIAEFLATLLPEGGK